VDVVTLTSPSAARSLAAVQPDLRRVRIAVIGRTTASVAEESGLPVHIVAIESTIEALAAAVAADVRTQRRRRDD
jgi:uroporphyrinogen-III synthase